MLRSRRSLRWYFGYAMRNTFRRVFSESFVCRFILRPDLYIAFLPCRMQVKQKIMKQIISLSIVSVAFDTTEMRRMNRA